MARPPDVAKIFHCVEEQQPSEEDTVIMDLLSNSAAMGTGREGMPVPHYCDMDGKYHVPVPSSPPQKKNNQNDIAKL
jgi:hypothetical protein